MNREDTLLLVERYRNGWHGQGVHEYGTYSISGGGSLKSYADRMRDGCAVVDKSTIDSDSAISSIVNGPMPKVTLPDNTVQRFGDRETVIGLAGGLSGDFGELAAKCVRDKTWRGLDYVSVDLYVAAWAQLGARVGRWDAASRSVVWGER